MQRFLSGPPGGRTLPLTPTHLADLAGGVYGPGASVASTGLNVQRPAIKAARARAAGETWEDILEYYIVGVQHPLHVAIATYFKLSSTQIVAKPTSLSVSEKSSTTAAYTTHQVGSHLAARVSVEYHGTSSAPVITSNPSRGRCGRATQVTDKEGAMKTVQLVLLRLRPVI